MDGSIRRNVAIGLDANEIDDTRVWEALDKASLGDFLRSDGLTLDSPVGERGVRLSGGQRQRLGLARALYTRPKLLVLDEATSALDSETENTINKVLQELAGSVTLITIAHRLATVRNANTVVYIEDGQIRATGSFEEVRAAIPGFDKQASLLGL
jgi:ABC-type multidrug transport system fused ATPase/permease subunit